MYVERIKCKVQEMNKILIQKEEEMNSQKEYNKKQIETLSAENIDLKDKIEYNNAMINSLKQSDEITELTCKAE